MKLTIQEAFLRLFPDSDIVYDFHIRYSGRFSDYNANVRMIRNHIQFNLSKKWRGVNKEIMIGLFQTLFLKLFNKKANTLNIDLYNSFIKNLHHTIPVTESDPILESSFNRINEKYFRHNIVQPNLVWGAPTKRKLGSYDFQTDTISISSILKNQDRELLDYVMHHEMLHKLLQFKTKNGRTSFHNTAFRKAERAFENHAELERRLKYVGYGRKKKKFSVFSFFK